MKWLRSGLAPVLLLALACSSQPRFNILLITIDTCRPDHLGCYGYLDIATPNLDRLVSEGVIFQNARSCVPLTLPSHVSIMTGRYPYAHGVRDNGSYVVPESLTTLAEDLRQHGYSTAAFISAFTLESRFNLDQGFDYYGDYFDHIAYQGAPGAGDIVSMSSERPADAVSAELLEWLKSLGREPFFTWVHYFDPHEPYEARAPYDEQYVGREYDAEIAFVDHCLGSILDHLEKTALLERTIVVVTADHGEGLGDHGEDDHGILVYDSTLKVPLVIRAPKRMGLCGRVSLPVETVDIVPTVLSLLGIELDRDLDGISLVNVMHGGATRPRISYFESLMGKLHFDWSELAGVQCGSWKYIHGPKPELYDIETDPNEQNDLFDAFPEVAELLRKKLLLFTSRWATNTSTTRLTIDAETHARLLSLGYTAAQEGLEMTTARFSGPDPREHMASYRWLTAARRRVYRAEWAEAVDAYRRALDVSPRNKDALMGLPLALMMNGEAASALQEARHAADVHPSQGETSLVLAMLQLCQGQPSEAQRTAEIALSHGAEPVAALTLIGQCAETTGNMDDAERAYREALAHDSCNLHSSMCLARVLMSARKSPDLERTLKRAAEDHPLVAMAHYDYGTVLLSENKTHDARRCLERAIELCPSHSNAHHALAVLLHGQGEDAEALHHLQAAIALTKSPVQLAEARSLADQISRQ